MVKIFQFNNSKVERKNQAEPMDAVAWFEAQQPLLLWMANKSRDGRKLLGLDQVDLPRIDRVAMNRVGMDRYVRDGGTLFRPLYRRVSVTDFRTAPKWANLVNSQWDWFCELAREYYSLMEKRRLPHVGMYMPVTLHRGYANGSTSTFYPDPNPETTTVDGWLRGSTGGAGAYWATLRAHAGSHNYDSDATGNLFQITAAGDSTKFDMLARSVFLFDTSTIPDGDTITDATFGIYALSGTDPDSNSPNWNVYSSAPASNTSLAAGDFDSLGETAYGDTASPYSSWVAESYVTLAFNATGKAAVSKTGVTKLGVRNANYDTANVSPTWSAWTYTTTMQCYFAESTGTSKDPYLLVTHSSGPAASRRSIIVA